MYICIVHSPETMTCDSLSAECMKLCSKSDWHNLSRWISLRNSNNTSNTITEIHYFLNFSYTCMPFQNSRWLLCPACFIGWTFAWLFLLPSPVYMQSSLGFWPRSKAIVAKRERGRRFEKAGSTPKDLNWAAVNEPEKCRQLQQWTDRTLSRRQSVKWRGSYTQKN